MGGATRENNTCGLQLIVFVGIMGGILLYANRVLSPDQKVTILKYVIGMMRAWL